MNTNDQLALLELRFHYDKSDIYLATIWNCLRTPSVFAAPIAFMISFYIVSTSIYSWAYAILGGILIFCLNLYFSARSTLNKPAILDPITLAFREDGVGVEFSNEDAHTASWSLIEGVYENEKFVFLRMRGRGLNFIPTNKITDSERNALREILREHVPNRLNHIPA